MKRRNLGVVAVVIVRFPFGLPSVLPRYLPVVPLLVRGVSLCPAGAANTSCLASCDTFAEVQYYVKYARGRKSWGWATLGVSIVLVRNYIRCGDCLESGKGVKE